MTKIKVMRNGRTPRQRARADILGGIARLMDEFPDLRVGQLVEDVLRMDDHAAAGKLTEAEQHWQHCIWNVTDEEALVRLRKFESVMHHG